ncbi:hypothetical protein ABN702_05820 [Bacillus haimaensis]|uniref:hypothetical protein n=1 Tax=Bacillus haimaensis TaxID=3160967 RepID=UPI003AA945E5
MAKKLLSFVLLLFLFYIIYNPILQVDNNVIDQTEYGTLLRFYDNEHSLSSLQLTHNITDEEEYNPNIEIGNYFPDKGLYRLYFFLDYKQIDVEVDDERKRFVEVWIEPFQTKSMNFRIPSINVGRHDLIIIASRDPEVLDQDQYISSSLHYIVRRTTLIKEKDIVPDIKYTSANDFNISREEPSLLFISKKYTSDLTQQINITGSEFWINIPSFSKNIATIAMLDDEQVDISHSFISSNFTGNIGIPIKIEKENPLPQNLLIATFDSPFEKMENNSGELIELFRFEFLNKVKIK